MTGAPPGIAYFQNTRSHHAVRPRVYELSELRAANVRDQIVRATHLVDSILRAGEIDTTMPLLVLGGGAAGQTAAMTALHAGVTVCLLERESTVFAVQTGVASRWICPVEFDWPHPGWDQGQAASDRWRSYPLSFRRARAAVIATAWTKVSDSYRSMYRERFIVLCNTDARTLKFVFDAQGVQVPSLPSRSGAPKRYGAVVSCIGFGDEVVSDPQKRWAYTGVRFWGDDRLTRTRLALPQPSMVEVLVSGAGDGAMQDVLRTLTGTFGAGLVKKLSAANTDHPQFAERFQAMAASCHGIDGQAWDSLEWKEHHGQDPKDLQAWHQSYEDLVETHWRLTPEAEREWQVENVLRQDIRQSEVRLTWLMRHPFFTVCYPLNRVLVLWLLRLYALCSGRPRLAHAHEQGRNALRDDAIAISGFEIAKVRGAGRAHVCGSRSSCDAQPHHVEVSRVASPQDAPQLLGVFHEIVVRHGVRPEPIFGHAAPPQHLRSQDIAGSLGDAPAA